MTKRNISASIHSFQCDHMWACAEVLLTSQSRPPAIFFTGIAIESPKLYTKPSEKGSLWSKNNTQICYTEVTKLPSNRLSFVSEKVLYKFIQPFPTYKRGFTFYWETFIVFVENTFPRLNTKMYLKFYCK